MGTTKQKFSGFVFAKTSNISRFLYRVIQENMSKYAFTKEKYKESPICSSQHAHLGNSAVLQTR